MEYYVPATTISLPFIHEHSTTFFSFFRRDIRTGRWTPFWFFFFLDLGLLMIDRQACGHKNLGVFVKEGGYDTGRAE